MEPIDREEQINAAVDTDLIRQFLENAAGLVTARNGRQHPNLASVVATMLAAIGALGASPMQFDFATKAAATAIVIPAPILFVRLGGYAAAGDGGGAQYARVGSQPTHAGKFQSSGGVWWELAEEEPTPIMFGAVDRAYGADCTTGIQNCLDYAAAKARRSVFIPDGIYKTTNTLLVPSNCIVRGAGRGATIIRSPNTVWAGKVVGGGTHYAGFAMIAAHNSEVRSLTVDHQTDTGPDVHGIIIDQDQAGNDSYNCTIFDCEVKFTSTRGHYLFWSRKAHGSKILFNYGDGGTTTNNATTFQEGIEVYGGSEVTVQGNSIKNVGNNCFYVNPEPTYSGAASHIRFIGNYGEVSQYGFHILPGSNVTDVIFAHNQIVAPWNVGIEIDCGTGVTVSNIKIISNYITGGVTSVLLDNTGGGTTLDILLDSNTFVGATSTGSGSIDSNNFSNTTFINNTVVGAAGYGARVVNGDRVRVAGNTIKDCQKSALVITEFGSGLTVSNVFANDNSFLKFNVGNGGDAGVVITGVANATVRANRFDTAHPAVYAVYVPDTSSDRVIIDGNVLLYDPGSQNPVFRNSGSNPNRATCGPVAATTASIIVNNTLVNYSSKILLNQTTGTPKTVLCANSPGSFTITFPAGGAAGDEVFDYSIAA